MKYDRISPHEETLYEDLVERLLYLESIRDIKHALQGTVGLDIEKLLDVIGKQEQKCTREKNQSRLLLLRFIHEIISEVSAERNLPQSQISNSGDLIDAALHASDAGSVYSLLTKHHHLITSDLYFEAEQEILQKAGSSQALYRSFQNNLMPMILLHFLSLILNDKAVLARSLLWWAAYCRYTHRYSQAEHCINRSQKIVEDIGDVELILWVGGVQASLYDAMDKNDKAICSYENILEKARAHGRAEEFPIRRRLAECYRTAGRYSAALKMIDSCLADPLLSSIPDQEPGDRLFKGLILEDLGNYVEGQVEFARAAKLAEAFGDRNLQFEALNDSAASLLKQNRAEAAVRQFEQILQTVKKWGNPVGIGSTYNNLGNALLQAYRPADALTTFGKALRLKINSSSYGEAISYIGMGDAFKALGEIDKARSMYIMALVPYQESGDLNIITLFAPRILAMDAKMSADAASLIINARERTKETGDFSQELMMTQIIIEYYLERGEESKAEALYREEINLSRDRDQASPQVIKLQVGLAKLLEKHKSYKEAYELLTNSLRAIDRQLDKELIDAHRGEIVSSWIELYGALIKLLLIDDVKSELTNVDSPEELAFDLHESAKSRSFLASLSNVDIPHPESIPFNVRDRERRLLSFKRSLQEDDEDGEPKSTIYRQRRLQEVRNELEACWNEMEPYAPEYIRLRRGNPATFEELESFLLKYNGPRMAFISFFSDDNGTVCFVVRSDERKLHVFTSEISRNTLNNIAVDLRQTFNGSPQTFPPLPPIRRDNPWARDLKFFEQLGDELLKFLPIVEGVELLCVLPHGPLHHLPLHALKTREGKFLIEHFAITYCPSLSTLSYCLSKEALTVVDVNSRPSVYVAGVASQQDAHVEYFEEDDQIFNNEAWKVEADLGQSAARSKVLQALDKHQIVHLACHGYYSTTSYLDSGLLFSNGQEKPLRDVQSISVLKRNQFVVRIRDLLRTRMQAQIVSLRACSTGFHMERNMGDEFEGLGRALLYSGNRAVVNSLWNVDQQSSLKLLTIFYQNLIQTTGMTEKWRALWMAQKSLLASGEQLLSHPYHWAPFVLIGDWR